VNDERRPAPNAAATATAFSLPLAQVVVALDGPVRLQIICSSEASDLRAYLRLPRVPDVLAKFRIAP
jgi:hypothetical protein